jgi:hypothetical protein
MPLEITPLVKGAAFTVQSAQDQAFINFADDFKQLDGPGKKGAFARFRGDIIKARRNDKDGKEEPLCQACWNVICKLYPEAPPAVQGDHPLPGEGSQKASTGPKVAANAIPDPSGIEYDTWMISNRTYIDDFKGFEKYQPEDEPPELKDSDWDKVVDSVYLLGVKYKAFEGFFKEVHNTRIAVESDQNFKLDTRKIRLRPLLRKMIPNPQKGRKSADLDNYKGACSEILDVFRTMQFRHPDVVRIANPTGNKKFEVQDVAQYLLVKPADASDTWKPLMEQDIDRTEVQNGKIKFYIEVKSDVHTAVKKHEASTDQLDRIIAVVKNRMRKPGNKLDRRPAVSIVNPKDWLELFTTNTAKNYCSRQFWLFIDNMLISPQTLECIDKDVWSKACPGQQYSSKAGTDELKLLEKYFAKEKGKFPAPSVNVKSQ